MQEGGGVKIGGVRRLDVIMGQNISIILARLYLYNEFERKTLCKFYYFLFFPLKNNKK